MRLPLNQCPAFRSQSIEFNDLTFISFALERLLQLVSLHTTVSCVRMKNVCEIRSRYRIVSQDFDYATEFYVRGKQKFTQHSVWWRILCQIRTCNNFCMRLISAKTWIQLETRTRPWIVQLNWNVYCLKSREIFLTSLNFQFFSPRFSRLYLKLMHNCLCFCFVCSSIRFQKDKTQQLQLKRIDCCSFSS